MPFDAFQPLNEVAAGGIPDSHASIERASGNVPSIRGDSNGRHAILNTQCQDLLGCFNVPKSNRLVAAPRRYMPTVLGEVERVNVLFVTAKSVFDPAGGDIPDLECEIDQSRHHAK